MDIDLKSYLDLKADEYNHPGFIPNDPICVPHLLSEKADIEITGFLVATIAWGNRNSIIKNGMRLLELMNNEPFNFVMQATDADIRELNFVHRTFNSIDLQFFIRSLRRIYHEEGGLEEAFSHGNDVKEKIDNFRKRFLEIPHEKRSEKHLSSPVNGSAAKRINMYLRWMVRKDKRGVDFGLWSSVPPSELVIPLDVHTGNVARELGLIKRKANDWRAVDELMQSLRKFDPDDPAKYDFALFGIGVNKDLSIEKF